MKHISYPLKNKLGRTPTSKEFVKELGTQRYKHLIFKIFGSWTEAVKEAGLVVPRPKNIYTDEQLIEYLVRYHKQFGKIPTTTDCKRKLIPSKMAYVNHFGSLPKARELAGIRAITPTS